jgi:hypothetical protein
MKLQDWLDARAKQPNPLMMSIWALVRTTEGGDFPARLIAAGAIVEQTPVGDQLLFEDPGVRELRPTIEAVSLHDDHAELRLWGVGWRLYPLDIARGKLLGIAEAEGMQEGDAEHESLFAANFDGSLRAAD